jgi:hypothetical protein
VQSHPSGTKNLCKPWESRRNLNYPSHNRRIA